MSLNKISETCYCCKHKDSKDRHYCTCTDRAGDISEPIYSEITSKREAAGREFDCFCRHWTKVGR